MFVWSVWASWSLVGSNRCTNWHSSSDKPQLGSPGPPKWGVCGEKRTRVKISPRPRVHYAEKFENAALFLRLDLLSTMIRHQNRALFLRLDLLSTVTRHENTALFLRLDLLSTITRHENTALLLRLHLLSTIIRHESQRNLKTLSLYFSVDGKHFANGTFQK